MNIWYDEDGDLHCKNIECTCHILQIKNKKHICDVPISSERMACICPFYTEFQKLDKPAENGKSVFYKTKVSIVTGILEKDNAVTIDEIKAFAKSKGIKTFHLYGHGGVIKPTKEILYGEIILRPLDR
jgi:hypothetical protein